MQLRLAGLTGPLAGLTGLLAGLVVSSLTGCPTPPPTLLVVDMKTDVKPLVEFDSIDTEVFALSDEAYANPVRPVADMLARNIDDAVAGVRLAEFAGLASGSWRVRVRLMRGVDEVASRRALVRVRGARAVTVLITRDCEDVSCPDEGGDPSATECLAGRCVVEECTPETPERCPDRECASDDQCDPLAGAPSCAEGVCFDGYCATFFNDDGCEGTLQCVVQGCRQVLVVDPQDAGAADAGVDAAPMDAALDAGPRDAGVDAAPMDAALDAGPRDAGVDAAPMDAALDAGPRDAGVDAAPMDGALDAGSRDAGVDAGSIDAGVDAGVGDAGLFDAGGPVEVVEVTAGAFHTCARLSSGEVRCWGGNDSAQLGDGTRGTSRLRPVAVMGVAGAVEITASAFHTCVRLGSGEVRCWGDDQFGQLGDGAPGSNERLPVAMMGVTDAVDISAAWAHTCVCRASGEVSCCGYAASGRLGTGASGTSSVSVPSAVMGVADAVEVAAGETHTCARLASGEVRCWGANGAGQLADGTSTTRLVSVAVMGVSDAVEIATGDTHTCARLGTGEVRCWGGNGSGQLGDGTSGTNRLLPVPVTGIVDAVELTTGLSHTCAGLVSGEVRCWGNNDSGQLGDGTSGTNRLLPVPVVGIVDAVEVTAGEAHVCARLGSGEVRCWGLNDYGQLGDGTRTDSLLPVPVGGLE